MENDQTDVIPLEPRPRVPVPVPVNFQEQLAMANLVIKSGLAPATYKSPEAVVIGLQMGAELGMMPMQALRFINVIQGRPTLSAQGRVAVILASGKAEYFYPEEQTPTRATWVTKRKGAPGPVRCSFTIEQAKAAGLIEKNQNYKTYPERMLSARASGFLAQDVYADVVGGILSPEEASDLTPEMPEPIVMPRATDETAAIEHQADDGAIANAISDAQRKRLFALTREHGKTHEELRAYLATLGIDSTNHLPVDQYDAVCAWVQGTEAA